MKVDIDEVLAVVTDTFSKVNDRDNNPYEHGDMSQYLAYSAGVRMMNKVVFRALMEMSDDKQVQAKDAE